MGHGGSEAKAKFGLRRMMERLAWKRSCRRKLEEQFVTLSMRQGITKVWYVAWLMAVRAAFRS